MCSQTIWFGELIEGSKNEFDMQFCFVLAIKC